MAIARLRQAQHAHVEDSPRHIVSGAFKCRTRDGNDVLVVVDDRGHVLDHDRLGREYLCGSRHAGIQSIPGILPTAMVVEVRVSLTGRATDQEVDGAHTVAQRSLGPGQASRAELRVEQLLYWCGPEVVGFEVAFVPVNGRPPRVHSEPDLEGPTGPRGGYRDAERDASRTAEDVNQTQRVARGPWLGRQTSSPKKASIELTVGAVLLKEDLRIRWMAHCLTRVVWCSPASTRGTGVPQR